MQPYQNFQPMMQPQYPSMYGQVQPPYLDRLSQLQNMQQNLQQPQQQTVYLNGRMVDSVESIVASEVPMDGNFAVFPKRDMSEVYLKYWTGEGKIATVIFKPISETYPSTLTYDQQKAQFEGFAASLEGLSDKVDKLSNRLDEVLRIKNSYKQKREVNSNE